MTILKCSAAACTYNQNMLCSKGAIDVGGEDARYADETCCSSFRDRTSDSAQNSCAEHCGCDSIQIDCQAHNCTYNQHCKCTAASIDIAGDNASSEQDTKCDTFQCKA